MSEAGGSARRTLDVRRCACRKALKEAWELAQVGSAPRTRVRGAMANDKLSCKADPAACLSVRRLVLQDAFSSREKGEDGPMEMECAYCFKRERELCSPMVVDFSPSEAEVYLKAEEAVRAFPGAQLAHVRVALFGPVWHDSFLVLFVRRGAQELPVCPSVLIPAYPAPASLLVSVGWLARSISS